MIPLVKGVLVSQFLTSQAACESCEDAGWFYNGYLDFDPAMHTPIACGCGAQAPADVRFLWAIEGVVARFDAQDAERYREQLAVEAVCTFIRRAANGTVAPRPKAVVVPRARCICESDAYAIQVFRAADYNERRAGDAPAWDVPDWVTERAAETMNACKATIHFPQATLDVWYGMDATTTQDEERREDDARRFEDALAAYSTRDEVSDRWEGESDGYEATEAFIRQLTETRRRQLAALIVHLGGSVDAPETIAWVKSRIEAKHGNALRGYCSCIYSLRARLKKTAAAA